jgi:hypothetical protein
MTGVVRSAVSGLAVLPLCGPAAWGGGGGATSSPPPAATLLRPLWLPTAGPILASASVTGQAPNPTPIPVALNNEVAGTTYCVGATYTSRANTSMRIRNSQ